MTSIAWSSVGDRARPTLVFAHSLGCDSSMWRHQIDGLGDEFHLLTVDMRGHGESDAPPGPYSLEALGADLMEVVDGAAVENFSICGISIGGLIALWAGIRHPGRVQSLIAANTAAKVGTAEGWEDRIRAVNEEGMAGIAEGVVGRWFTLGFASRHPDRWAEAIATFVATDPEGYIGCCQALAGADLGPDVASIVAPTLLIGGDADPSTPPSEAQWLHDQIPSSQLEIFPDAAHLTNLEHPDLFTQKIKAFLH